MTSAQPTRPLEPGDPYPTTTQLHRIHRGEEGDGHRLPFQFFLLRLVLLSLSFPSLFASCRTLLSVLVVASVMSDNTWMSSLRARVADLDPNRIIEENVFDGKSEEEIKIQYQCVKVVGNGSFGVVFQVKIVEPQTSSRDAAIKRVLQDKRFKVVPSNSCDPSNTSHVESRIANYEIDFTSKCRRSQILLFLSWRKSTLHSTPYPIIPPDGLADSRRARCT